jgi:hypothetical protein
MLMESVIRLQIFALHAPKPIPMVSFLQTAPLLLPIVTWAPKTLQETSVTPQLA